MSNIVINNKYFDMYDTDKKLYYSFECNSGGDELDAMRGCSGGEYDLEQDGFGSEKLVDGLPEREEILESETLIDLDDLFEDRFNPTREELLMFSLVTNLTPRVMIF